MDGFDVSLRFSADLSLLEQGGLLLLVLATWFILFWELRRRARFDGKVAITGALGVLLLALAVARPVRVEEQGQKTGARVVVLVDGSERMSLPGDEEQSRRADAEEVVEQLRRRYADARLEVFTFGEGEIRRDAAAQVSKDSSLLSALEQVTRLPGDRAQQVVVVSDGRLTTPGAFRGSEEQSYREALGQARQDLSVSTVGVVQRIPRDRSVRAVHASGSVVAHQAFPLTVELGCEPHRACPEVDVVVRELLENSPPIELSRGKARFEEGQARLELSVTLERAGSRVIEVSLEGGETDEIPDNDKRILPFEVRRDRMRILHVAGRPTYDVRALRMFLKSDESIDLISFFILRTLADRVGAPESELALIPFPVEELFTEHLPSFDAIILQDIDAREYQLDRHFVAMRDYVKKGGGLILVGGPGAFAAGGYAGSALAEVLPVHLPLGTEGVNRQPVEPEYTSVGAVAPMLAGLRQHLGFRLPSMAGANILGQARPGALVLWEHPSLPVAGASNAGMMPLLALAEMGDGRSIALGVDGTHKLRFGELGAEAAGRGHTALWEGLLGWLMRDQRYEAARIEAPRPCFAGRPFELRVLPLPGMGTEVVLSLEQLSVSGAGAAAPREKLVRKQSGPAGEPFVFRFEGVEPGGYVARAQVGAAPPTRLVFACEAGGGAFSDSRPDPERLEKIAELSQGKFVWKGEVERLPEARATRVLARSVTKPLVPDWVWAGLSSLVLAAHWWFRRVGGFS